MNQYTHTQVIKMLADTVPWRNGKVTRSISKIFREESMYVNAATEVNSSK